MYKLFTDKSELFECDITLQGASVKKSKARLVIDTKDYSIMFNGTISESGKCKIPIKKLKGLIDENTSGNIRLEVIAEDTFFVPWETDFKIETSKKVTVEIKSQPVKPTLTETKVSVAVKNDSPKKQEAKVVKKQEITKSEKQHVINLFKLLRKENINMQNITVKRNKVNNIVGTYLKENVVVNPSKVIKDVISVLTIKK